MLYLSSTGQQLYLYICRQVFNCHLCLQPQDVSSAPVRSRALTTCARACLAQKRVTSVFVVALAPSARDLAGEKPRGVARWSS